MREKIRVRSMREDKWKKISGFVLDQGVPRIISMSLQPLTLTLPASHATVSGVLPSRSLRPTWLSASHISSSSSMIFALPSLPTAPCSGSVPYEAHTRISIQVMIEGCLRMAKGLIPVPMVWLFRG